MARGSPAGVGGRGSKAEHGRRGRGAGGRGRNGAPASHIGAMKPGRPGVWVSEGEVGASEGPTSAALYSTAEDGGAGTGGPARATRVGGGGPVQAPQGMPRPDRPPQGLAWGSRRPEAPVPSRLVGEGKASATLSSVRRIPPRPGPTWAPVTSLVLTFGPLSLEGDGGDGYVGPPMVVGRAGPRHRVCILGS